MGKYVLGYVHTKWLFKKSKLLQLFQIVNNLLNQPTCSGASLWYAENQSVQFFIVYMVYRFSEIHFTLFV